MPKLNFLLKRLLLTIAVVTALIMASTLLVSDHTQPTDCEIAHGWYHINWYGITTVESFEIFLEKRFRFFDVKVTGGLFASPEYRVAIQYPKADRIKEHIFLISRDGAILPQRSISISMQEWSNARKINCGNFTVEVE